MSQAEELAALRQWLREDIHGLHKKLDERDAVWGLKMEKFIAENLRGHQLLQAQLTEIDKKTSVTGAVASVKIAGFVALLSIAVAGIASAAWHKLLT